MEPKDPLGVAKEPVSPDLEAGAEQHAEGRETRQEAIGPASRPLLMVDIDGVISLFAPGWQAGGTEGSFHSIEGIPHFLSATAAAHLLALRDHFELIWASGWEERANEHLPHLLGLPADLPFLRFERAVGRSNAHWKLDAIERHAGRRPLAWIDDALDPACHSWAAARAAPTLLVQTEPSRGLRSQEADELIRWARSLAPA